MIVDIDLGVLTMLIVDGGSYERSLIRSILASFGAGSVLLAANHAEAVAILADHPVDLVVVDRNSGGLELTRQLRRGDAGCRIDLPIVMISGSADGGQAAEARNSGIDEFLAKPVTAESLYRRVRSALTHPRPFVQSSVYIGPCRRSIELPPGTGERRVNSVAPATAPAGGQRTSHRRYPAGAIIFAEGEGGDEAFVIESGCVVISRQLGGRNVVLGSLGPQGIFGELALAEEALRGITATAAEATVCLVLPKRALAPQIARSPDLVVLVLETLLRNIGKMGRELVEAHARLHQVRIGAEADAD